MIYSATNLRVDGCDNCQPKRKQDILGELVAKNITPAEFIDIDMTTETITFVGTKIQHENLINFLKEQFKIGFSSNASKNPIALTPKSPANSISTPKNSFWCNLLYICGFLCIPLIFIQMVAPYIPLLAEGLNQVLWSDWASGHLTLGMFLSMILATLVQIFIGRHFYIATWQACRQSTCSMMALFAVGTTAAYVSAMVMAIYRLIDVNFEMMTSFDTNAMIFLLVVVGKRCEEYAKTKARSAVDQLRSIEPQYVFVLPPSTTDTNISITEKRIFLVSEGSQILVQPGERIPIDGKILETSQIIKNCREDEDNPSSILQVQETSRNTNCIVWIDESMWTGESMPVNKMRNGEVRAGSIYKTSTESQSEPWLRIQTTVPGEKTSISILRQSLEQADAKKLPIQEWADRISNFIVPGIMIAALVTGLVWLVLLYTGLVLEDLSSHGYSWMTALNYALSVLVVSCPCALGLATPTAILVGFSVAYRHHLLIKEGKAFEIAYQAKAVVFDKTGTLTQNSMDVIYEHYSPNMDNVGKMAQLKQILYFCESQQRHPIAKAIQNWCQPILKISSNANLEDHGSIPLIPSSPLTNLKLLNDPKKEIRQASNSSQQNSSVVLTWSVLETLSNNEEVNHTLRISEVVCKDQFTPSSALGTSSNTRAHQITLNDDCLVCLHFEEKLVDDAKACIHALQKKGIDCYILSGDKKSHVSRVANQLELSKEIHLPTYRKTSTFGPNFQSKLPGKNEPGLLEDNRLPPSEFLKNHFMYGCVDKGKVIEQLRNFYDGPPVIMVGDGMNDAEAMKKADVSIAISSGSALALESAHIVLNRHSLVDIVTVIDLSRVVHNRIRINIIWAVLYNVVSIPIAAGAVPSLRMVIEPMYSAAAMMLSSLVVVCSSLLLQCYRPPLKSTSNNSIGYPSSCSCCQPL